MPPTARPVQGRRVYEGRRVYQPGDGADAADPVAGLEEEIAPWRRAGAAAMRGLGSIVGMGVGGALGTLAGPAGTVGGGMLGGAAGGGLGEWGAQLLEGRGDDLGGTAIGMQTLLGATPLKGANLIGAGLKSGAAAIAGGAADRYSRDPDSTLGDYARDVVSHGLIGGVLGAGAHRLFQGGRAVSSHGPDLRAEAEAVNPWPAEGTLTRGSRQNPRVGTTQGRPPLPRPALARTPQPGQSLDEWTPMVTPAAVRGRTPRVTHAEQVMGMDPERVAMRSAPPPPMPAFLRSLTGEGDDAAMQMAGARQPALPIVPEISHVPGVDPWLPPQAPQAAPRPAPAATTLPPASAAAGASDDVVEGLAQAGETGIENAARRGVPYAPAELYRRWLDLRPQWERTLQETGVDQRETLENFMRRVLKQPNPRKLMGGERKAVAQARERIGREIPSGPDAPLTGALESPPAVQRGGFADFLDRLNSDESGEISTELAQRLGIHAGAGAVGAGVGAAVSKPGDRTKGALEGGALGLALPLLLSHPEQLAKLRYFSMLGSMGAQGKNIIGNTGSIGVRALEEALTGNPKRGAEIIRQLLSRKTLDKGANAFKSAPDIDTRWGTTHGVLGVPSRVMHAVDEAATDALERGGLGLDEAKRSLFTSEPLSLFGQGVAKFAKASPISRVAVPFSRTATNILERGIEHTPGLGLLPAVRKMRGDSLGRSLARQGMGAVALGAGAAGITPDNPYLEAFMGPLAIPHELGKTGRAAWDAKGDRLLNVARTGLNTLRQAVPMPTDAWQYEPGRILASFMPGFLGDLSPDDPRNFDVSGSLLAPTVAKVPFLNSATLRRRRRRPQRARR